MIENSSMVFGDQLNRIFNSIPALIAISTLKDGRFIDVNNIFLRSLGYKREDVVGHTSRELNIFVDYENRKRMVDNLEKNGEIVDVETKIRSRSGYVLDGLFSASVTEINGERCLITVFKDITEQKNRELQLRLLSLELNERVKELNCLHSISTITHLENVSFETLLQRIVEVIPAGFQYPDVAEARIVIYGNEYKTVNFKDTDIFVKSDISVFGKNDGVIEVCYVEDKDISEKKGFLKEEKALLETIAERLGKNIENIQALNFLNESEQKYRSIFENAVEGIFQTTPEGKFINANPALAAMLGYDSPEDLVKGVTDLSKQGYVDPEDRKRYLRIIEEQGVIKGFETEHYRKDGSKIWVLINARAAKDETGKTLYYEGTIEDITRQKKAEEQLRYERKRFSTLSENAPFGMAMIDADGRFIYI